MVQENKSDGRTNRLVPNSSEDLVFQAIKKIHKENGNYELFHKNKIFDEFQLDNRCILQELDNFILPKLERMKMIEICSTNEFQIRVHEDYWIKFSSI